MTFTGTLSAPAIPASWSGEAEPTAERLIDAVTEVRAARGDMDDVMRLFRRSAVWVETELDDQRHSVRAVRNQGLWWLPVFSSLEQE